METLKKQKKKKKKKKKQCVRSLTELLLDDGTQDFLKRRQNIWARLFKTNDIVNIRFVKIQTLISEIRQYFC